VPLPKPKQPVSKKCEPYIEKLESGKHIEKGKVRVAVGCRTIQLVEEQGMDRSEAMGQAWKDVKKNREEE